MIIFARITSLALIKERIMHPNGLIKGPMLVNYKIKRMFLLLKCPLREIQD